jgi:hypothetical protein
LTWFVLASPRFGRRWSQPQIDLILNRHIHQQLQHVAEAYSKFKGTHMSKSLPELSEGYKIAFMVSAFFLINVLVSTNLARFNSVAAYIAGFSIGIASAFLGFGLHKRRRVFAETDVQLGVSVDLCKQLSAVSPRVLKSTPSEIAHLIYAAKAYYSEPGKTMESTSADVDLSKSLPCDLAKA